MIENVPYYVSTTFILTTFLTIGFFFYAIKKSVVKTNSAKIIVFLVGFWLIFTAVLGTGGFYLTTTGFPPRFALLPVPPLILIILIFIFSRDSFIEKLPLKTLTLLHIVRIPVEIVLFWLYKYGMIPQLMTFEGRNFDIIAGITAPIVFWFCFRKDEVNSKILIVWNIICLLLVTNIVTNAILSLPVSFQQFAFDQPNRGVLYFPYVWLPGIIVPIVFFTHFASLWQLFKKNITSK